MAAGSFLSYNNPTTLQHVNNNNTSFTSFDPFLLSHHLSVSSSSTRLHNANCLQSFRPPHYGQRLSKRRLLGGVHATPETADALLSFFPGGDTPWFAWAGAAMVAVPLVLQRLVRFTNEVEAVAETVEGLADKVGKVADQIDKAADEMMEKLPDGQLKDLVNKVEDIAEATSREAQKVEDLMDKVEEISNEVEDFIVEHSKMEPAKVTSEKK